MPRQVGVSKWALGWGGKTDYAGVQTRRGPVEGGPGLAQGLPGAAEGHAYVYVCVRMRTHTGACLCVDLASKNSHERDCARLEQLEGRVSWERREGA